MHKHLPFPSTVDPDKDEEEEEPRNGMRKVVSENAVVIFAKKGCCMCHVAKLLLHGHGVNPAVVNVDEQNEARLGADLAEMIGEDGSSRQFPVVFVGGELMGGLEEIMGAHISGELVPKLRQARALWL